MIRFFMEHLGLTEAEAHALRHSFRGQHDPMSLHGLMDRYGIDPQVYLHEVHDLDRAPLLAPDPVLNDLLAELPGQRAIGEDAPLAHAERVLAALAITRHISGIYDLHGLQYQPKPDPVGYQRVLDHLAMRGQHAIMIGQILCCPRIGLASQRSWWAAARSLAAWMPWQQISTRPCVWRGICWMGDALHRTDSTVTCRRVQ